MLRQQFHLCQDIWQNKRQGGEERDAFVQPVEAREGAVGRVGSGRVL